MGSLPIVLLQYVEHPKFLLADRVAIAALQLCASCKLVPGHGNGYHAGVAPLSRSELPVNGRICAPLLPVPLTPTEKHYLQLFDAGWTNKEISDLMGISINTARTHGRNILLKTACMCLRQAACKIGGERIR